VDKKLTFEGAEVFYTADGSGLPLLLVHGFAEDSWIWEAQLARLKDQFRVLIPDLPGSGHSPFNPRITGLEGYADCLVAILDAEKVDQAVLVGHSMGGYIALAFGEKYSGRLQGLGLFHSTAYADSPEKIEARRKGIDFIGLHGSGPFLAGSIPNLFSETFSTERPEVVQALIRRYAHFDPAALSAYYQGMIDRPDRTGVLKSSSVPVLFVIGEQDKLIPMQDMLQQSQMPDISFIHILESAAHMGMLEAPTKSTLILQEFAAGIR
jgi:pimeloyl-ACP methyl ester carboxylesterase